MTATAEMRAWLALPRPVERAIPPSEFIAMMAVARLERAIELEEKAGHTDACAALTRHYCGKMLDFGGTPVVCGMAEWNHAQCEHEFEPTKCTCGHVERLKNLRGEE